MIRPRNLAARGGGRNSGTSVAAGLFVILFGIYFIISPAARSAYSVNNLAVLTATLGLAAVGTTLVLITGGFDLSVAGIISLANVLCATQMDKASGSVWLFAALICLGGLLVGLINGLLVVYLGLQSLAVTLGTYIVLTGFALVVLPAPGGIVPTSFAYPLTETIGGVPVAVLILITAAVFWMLFVRTRLGIGAFAVGSDPQAALMSGIRVRLVETSCFALAGGFYALAGLFLSAVTASGDPRSGQPFLLSAFAAVALGLVGLKGGRGSAIAAMFGAATLTVIPKLLFSAGVGDFWVGAVQGLIILVALSLPVLGSKLSSRMLQPSAAGALDPVGPSSEPGGK